MDIKKFIKKNRKKSIYDKICEMLKVWMDYSEYRSAMAIKTDRTIDKIIYHNKELDKYFAKARYLVMNVEEELNDKFLEDGCVYVVTCTYCNDADCSEDYEGNHDRFEHVSKSLEGAMDYVAKQIKHYMSICEAHSELEFKKEYFFKKEADGIIYTKFYIDSHDPVRFDVDTRFYTYKIMKVEVSK